MPTTLSPVPPPTRLDRRALAVLATASFAFVATETMPVGLLPQIADGLEVTEGQVGTLLTSYAAVAALTTIPATALTLRFDRRRLLVVLVAVFALSQAASALAPNLLALSGFRIACAVAHGIFWSSVAAVAARLAPPGQAGRATAVVFVGNSIALVAGLPLGAALGQLVGWRAAFGALALAGLVSTVALFRVLPPLPSLAPADAGLARTVGSALAVVRVRALLVVALVTLVLVVGHFAGYTYLAPLAERAGGLTGAGLTAVLVVYGATGLLGNAVAARWVDTRPGASLLGAVAGIVVPLAVLAVRPGPVAVLVAVAVWGCAIAVMVVVLQSTVLRVVPHARDAASSVYVVTFQVGIGSGALLGARLVDGGHLDALPVVAAAVALAAGVVVLVARGVFPLGRPADDVPASGERVQTLTPKS